MNYDVKDINLADQGALRVEWAMREMPVLASISERFAKEKPLKGVRLAACLHVTTETAALMKTLKAGGAELALCASNPLSTQDDVAAYLAKHEGIPTFAIKGEDGDTYYRHINQALDLKPQISMDDGADLVFTIHTKRQELIDGIWGGSEETTTGVIRLKAMSQDGVLRYPMIAVNDAHTKYLFDNRYGTGQSTVDGILRATNILLAGATFVVAGYGWCGRGIAMRARGMGANVVVTEVDPVRAIEAVMDGYRVMRMADAAKIADVLVTATGDINVIDKADLAALKDGAILANSGHFNDEIEIPALQSLAVARRRIREFVDEYRYADGRRVYLLAEGRLVNLSAAEGHPAAVMDMSFANQSLSAEYIVAHAAQLQPRVYVVPREIDREIARLKLRSMGVEIDELTAEQQKYLTSWQSGT